MPRISKHATAPFGHFVENAYLLHVRRHKRSWQVDERLARRHILPVFAARRLDRVNRNAVETWFANLAGKGLAPATCNRIFAVLQGIFAHAVHRGLLPANPCTSVKLYPVRPRLENSLSRDESSRLLAHLSGKASPAAAALRLLLLTGARKSEILMARWAHVHLEQKILTVPLSKSNKTRHVALSEAACAVLRALPRVPGCPWVFPGNRPERPLRNISHFWNRVREELGFGPVRIHDLRHTFASLLVQQGHSLYEVQHLLGHSDPRVTMRYAHLTQGGLIAAADSVGEMLELA